MSPKCSWNILRENFNPESVLQKSGHGSYVDLPTGEVYLVHLCSRPFVPELRCTLGRENAIQKMKWTEDGWLRMPHRFADVKARKGYVRICRQESRTSLNKVSILARKLTSVYAKITTKMEFTPEIHQHSAGLILISSNILRMKQKICTKAISSAK